tara:strand:- start:535 stop:681 length:147 start_codon:yes stop_codon:yes gene_type:complete
VVVLVQDQQVVEVELEVLEKVNLVQILIQHLLLQQQVQQFQHKLIQLQ